MWCGDPSSEQRCQLAAFDISRAYLHAETGPNDLTDADLLMDDPDSKRDMCGLLIKHMYGTRKAADGWQHHYAKAMREMGFVQGVASPLLSTPV